MRKVKQTVKQNSVLVVSLGEIGGNLKLEVERVSRFELPTSCLGSKHSDH